MKKNIEFNASTQNVPEYREESSRLQNTSQASVNPLLIQRMKSKLKRRKLNPSTASHSTTNKNTGALKKTMNFFKFD